MSDQSTCVDRMDARPLADHQARAQFKELIVIKSGGEHRDRRITIQWRKKDDFL